MYFTILNRLRRKYTNDYACITIPNGMKVNATFFWYCVDLGILSIDD